MAFKIRHFSAPRSHQTPSPPSAPGAREGNFLQLRWPSCSALTMIFREIQPRDIPAIFDVRTATQENPFSRDDLYSLGITEESVKAMLSLTHRGWLCEEADKIIGFSIADGNTGELWVIAVLPDFEGKGIGSRLLSIAEEWLALQGWPEFWLWTSTDTSLRAYQLYRRHGWRDSEIRDDQLYMKKRAEGGGGNSAALRASP